MQAADWILWNARIYTQDPEQPEAEALAVVGETLAAVGPMEAVRAWQGPRTRILDLKGATVLPGLIDAHLHLEGYARLQMGVDVDTPTLEEALARVARQAATRPPGEWIVGRGWLQERWGRFPTADDLDRVAPAHPVALWARSGHALWANREAMRRAGVTRDTPDPPGGRIARDAAGEPTGLFFERAIDGIARVIPEPSIEELAEALYEALHALAALGLTTAGDFIIIHFSHEALGLGSSAGDQRYHRLAVVSGGEAPCPCSPIAYWDNLGRSASPRRRHGALRPSVLR